jgi:hypothetical protein
VESSCEHGIEPSGSIKWWEVLEGLHNCGLLEKGLVYTRPNYTGGQDDIPTGTVFVFAAKTDTRRIGTSGSRDRPNYTNLLHYTLGSPSVYAASHVSLYMFVKFMVQSASLEVDIRPSGIEFHVTEWFIIVFTRDHHWTLS